MLVRLISRLWAIFLVLGLLLGGISIPPTIALYKNLSTDPIDLLRKDDPHVRTLQEVRRKIEKETQMGIVLESERPERTIAYMEELAVRLKGEPFVDSVNFRKIGYNFFEKYKLLFLNLEELKTIRETIHRRVQRRKLGPLFVDFEDSDNTHFKEIEEKYKGGYSGLGKNEYYSSEDGRLFSLFVLPRDSNPSLQAAALFYEDIHDFLKKEDPTSFEPTLKIHLAGPSKVLEFKALKRDLKVAGFISAICVGLPLLIRFRNPLKVLFIFFPLFLGIPISFALSSLFIEKLSVITSFLFAILGGLGVESGIHIFSRYESERESGRTREGAFRETFHHLGRSIPISVLAVAVTFLLLQLSHFRGFSEFGLIAGLGLLIILSLYFFFFPPLLFLMESVGLLRFKEKGVRGDGGPNLIRHWHWSVLAVPILFSVYSLAFPLLIQFEYDTKKIRADLPEVLGAKAKMAQTLSRLNKPATLVIRSKEESDLLIEVLEERRKKDLLTPTIDIARSYYNLVPADQAEKLLVIEELKKLLDDPAVKLMREKSRELLEEFRKALLKTESFTEREVPEEVRSLFEGKEGEPGRLLYINALPHLELDHALNAIQFSEDIGEITTLQGTYYPASDNIIFGKVIQLMLDELPKVILFSLISIFFFIYIDFRSIRESGLVFLSIVMGILWLFGLMGLFGLKFNIYNMIIIPAVMGMSVDNAIHVMHRYKELGRGSLDRVMSSTGIACLLASLTNAGGFAGLLSTVHLGLFSMGLIALLGIGTCLLSTLLFLPLLLNFFEGPSGKSP